MKLSKFLQKNILDTNQLHSVLEELATRLELVEREREDSGEKMSLICTCRTGNREEKKEKRDHVAVCPQRRGQ